MCASLRMAGYRGQGPIVTFLAIRLVMPFVLFAVAGFYVFAVLQLQYPFFAKLASSSPPPCSAIMRRQST